jgi:hypothetical protein
MQQKLVFCSVMYPGSQAEVDNLLLAESIRAYGGELADQPIWFFMPDTDEPLTDAGSQRLQALNVRVLPFKIERKQLQFFFMGQLAGLAQAEKVADGEVELLAWLDANTIVLHEPKELLLPPWTMLGYRPVHHLLLGSRYDQPLDLFWGAIYQACGVPPERVFPMKPVVEDVLMRPYFNAGILVTRPERGLLHRWYATFLELYQAPVFQAFYQQSPRYTIFMHQAVLAGVVLSALEREELLELPDTYNYPVHLFAGDTTSKRPAGIDALVTFRHEGFYENKDWADTFPASDELKAWLQAQLAQHLPAG